MDKPEPKQFLVRLPMWQYNRIKRDAAASDQSMTSMIKWIISDYYAAREARSQQ